MPIGTTTTGWPDMLNGPVKSAPACGPTSRPSTTVGSGPSQPKAGTGEQGMQDQVGLVEGSGQRLVELEANLVRLCHGLEAQVGLGEGRLHERRRRPGWRRGCP